MYLYFIFNNEFFRLIPKAYYHSKQEKFSQYIEVIIMKITNTGTSYQLVPVFSN
ncbi:hypothetical protein SAMN02787100_1839 [Chryseobacterium sp. OV279]|nr:hypothetical protein SAMN02787100_1839 [Chryseobacterium sp. OV279]